MTSPSHACNWPLLAGCAALSVPGVVASGDGGQTVAADVVAVTDSVVVIDVQAQTPQGAQRGWVVLGRSQSVVRVWRTLPQGSIDCEAAVQKFSDVLAGLRLDGVALDARQCGRHDAPFWAAAQRILDGNSPDARPPLDVTSPSLERLRATREAMAFGVGTGTRWAARFTGKSVVITRQGVTHATLPTGISPSPANGWVVVAPQGAMVVAYDAELRSFQMWIRRGPTWSSPALIDPLEAQ